MKVTRREFLALAGKTAIGAVILSACGIPEREFLVSSPVKSPEDVGRGQNNWYATTWPEATNAEGVIARVAQGRVNKLAGNSDHPVNRGKQAAYYDAGIQLLYHPDRIKKPLYRRTLNGRFDEISWEKARKIVQESATDLSANNDQGLAGTNVFVTNPLKGYLNWVVGEFINRYGGRSIALDPLRQGVLNGVLTRILSAEDLPHLDIGNAGAIVSFGADWLNSWLSPVQYSVAYGKFRSNPERGYFAHAESRMSQTAAAADLWLPVRPGAEGALAITIANRLIEKGLVGGAAVGDYERWVPRAVRSRYPSGSVEQNTGVTSAHLDEAVVKIGAAAPVLAFGGGSAEAHTNGSFNLTAIYALNALFGGFGKDGGIKANPAPPLERATGARHGAPIARWEKEIAQWNSGFVNTVFVRGVDLVHDLPSYLQPQNALANVPNVIVFGSFMNDTTAFANLILPETSFLEEWGISVPEPAPGYQTVSFQQSVAGEGTSAATDSRGLGDTLLQVAADANVPIGGFTTMQQVVQSAAADLRSVAGSRGSIRAGDDAAFLKGVLQRGGWWDAKSGVNTRVTPLNISDFERNASFGDTPSNGDELYLVPFVPVGIREGRLAPSPWAQQIPDPLSTAAWETWAEINSDYAREAGIREGDILYIRSAAGELRAVAYPHPGVPPNVVGVPLGLGQTDGGRYSQGLGDNVVKILVGNKTDNDQENGALAWASTKVMLVKQGRRIQLPKAEGSVEAYPVEPGVPVLIVKPGQSAHDAEEENHYQYQQEVYK